jgi:predicted acyl esterase
MSSTSGEAMTDAAWWKGESRSEPAKRFTATVRSSRYVTARDGTRIAIDLYLPEGLPPGAQLPTLLTQTPYFRSMEFRARVFERIVRKLAMLGQAEFAEDICRYGYANVNGSPRGGGVIRKETLHLHARRRG